ncbi:MAG: MmcQ/YjbR family DNA-binding protein [Spirochaetales bacterium]|nr:MmcQ/YjbR family DNA-binding protein [Spirochaetales bacterium]
MGKGSVVESVFEHISKVYKAEPEYLWARFPFYSVFRHMDNRKWFALVMDVPGNRLGLESDERVDIINLKLSDPMLVDFLSAQDGYFRGYHISNGNWISILLDGTVPLDEIFNWIAESFETTASRCRKRRRESKEWIVPANPRFFDIVHAFDGKRSILWKQGRGIEKNDTVFLYAASPVKAILYKCIVTATDIPYELDNGIISMDRVMQLRLLKRYRENEFSFERLKNEYGIVMIRGPIGVPHSLSMSL